jgi:hypothetical protein
MSSPLHTLTSDVYGTISLESTFFNMFQMLFSHKQIHLHYFDPPKLVNFA